MTLPSFTLLAALLAASPGATGTCDHQLEDVAFVLEARWVTHASDNWEIVVRSAGSIHEVAWHSVRQDRQETDRCLTGAQVSLIETSVEQSKFLRLPEKVSARRVYLDEGVAVLKVTTARGSNTVRAFGHHRATSSKVRRFAQLWEVIENLRTLQKKTSRTPPDSSR